MKKLASIIIIFISLQLQAQNNFTQTIRGIIIDQTTEMPLPGASIVVLNSNPQLGGFSNENGEFKIENVPIGRQSVQVSFMGYNTATLNNLMLSSGKQTVLTIKLEEKVILTEEVIVKAQIQKDRPLNEMATISARSFSIEETERYAGSLGDPSRMAANFAGVSSATDQRNDIIIRGNSPLGLLWRVDDLDVFNPNHFGSLGSTGGPISMLNNNVLSNSDFYTGAFPAEFGNATAGAFDLKLRTGNNQKHEFMGQIGFNGFELGAEGPISRKTGASYLANFRYSTLEVFNAMGMSFGTGTAIPQYKDLSFKIDIPTTNLGKFSVFGIGGISYIELLDSKNADLGFGGADIYFGANTAIAGISNTYFFSKNARLKTLVGYNALETNTTVDTLLRHGIQGKFPFDKEKDIDQKFTFSAEYSQKINSRNNFELGATYDIYKIDYNNSFYETDISDWINILKINGQTSMARGFIQWQHKFNNSLVLNSGVYSQLFNLNQTWSVEPRIGLKWNISKQQALSAAFGVHSQTQIKAVYFLEALTDTVNRIYERTNENLDFTKSSHFVLGYDFSLADNLRLKIETYYQLLSNVPVTPEQPEFSLFNQGDNFTFAVYNNMINSGKGENYGIELTLEKFLSKGYYYLFTASVFDSKYQGYDQIKRNSAFNNQYIFNLLGGYEFKLGEKSLLAFDIKGVWAGGKRYVPIDFAESQLKKTAEYDWANAYQNKYNDYFRVNIRITYKKNGKKLNQEYGLDLQNVTNQKNIFAENYDGIKNEIKTSYQMGFMPMMTYRIQF